MPVVLRPDDGVPLSQGNILRKISFAVTNAAGQLATDSKATYLLVVSRPCNALRDGAVTVAPVINFPTKTHWRSPSKLEYIEKGLPDLIEVIRNRHIRSVAIPRLGVLLRRTGQRCVH